MKRTVPRMVAGPVVGWAAVTLMIMTIAGAPARAGAPDAANGQKLYAKQQCSTCHKMGKKGGSIGPDLSKEGAKRDATWLAAFLKNPRSKVPKGSMPAVKASDKELQDLTAYMLTLK